jgi:CheY-like chemotaxis protein
LPACDDNELMPAAPTREAPLGQNELILLADDEYSVREIIKTTLDACGYQTLLADNGIEALEKYKLQQSEIACVIADLEMPKMAGLPCARILRGLDQDLPILLVSGANEGDAPLDEIKSVGAAYLSKPFSKTDLLIALQTCLAPTRSKTKAAS